MVQIVGCGRGVWVVAVPGLGGVVEPEHALQSIAYAGELGRCVPGRLRQRLRLQDLDEYRRDMSRLRPYRSVLRSAAKGRVSAHRC